MNLGGRLANAVERTVFTWPKTYLSLVGVVTLFCLAQVSGVKMYSDFAALLPQ